MYLPETVDHIILSFLGIKHRARCQAVNKNKTICKNKTHHNNLFCKTHTKLVNKHLFSKRFETIIKTYDLVYTKKRMNSRKKRTPRFDKHGYYGWGWWVHGCEG